MKLILDNSVISTVLPGPVIYPNTDLVITSTIEKPGDINHGKLVQLKLSDITGDIFNTDPPITIDDPDISYPDYESAIADLFIKVTELYSNIIMPINNPTNSGKFLKSGATAGSISWESLVIADIATLQAALDAKAQKDTNYFKHYNTRFGFVLDCFNPSLPPTTKFYTYDGDHESQSDVVKRMWEIHTPGVVGEGEKFAIRNIKYRHGESPVWKNQAIEMGRIINSALFSTITFYDTWIGTNCPIHVNKNVTFHKDNFVGPALEIKGQFGGGIVLGDGDKKLGIYSFTQPDNSLSFEVGYKLTTGNSINLLSVRNDGVYHKGVKLGSGGGGGNYTHPTGDGFLHVPATGTTNNGKVLKAGATAGSINWQSLVIADVATLQAALDAKATTITTGVLTSLNTTAKNNLVSAINEVNTKIGNGSSGNYVHPTGDGFLHVPVTGTTNNGKVLKAGATAGSIRWQSLVIADVATLQAALDAKATTITTGVLTSLNTTAKNNLVSAINEVNTKIGNGGSGNYVHPTGDGNLHVPVTGTTNNGKVLKAGATAGSISWQSLVIADVATLQAALDAKATTSHTHTIAQVTGLQAVLDAKALNTTIGILSSLNATITSRTNLVEAINFLNTKISTTASVPRSDIGELANLVTGVKTNIVAAINSVATGVPIDVVSRAEFIAKTKWINSSTWTDEVLVINNRSIELVGNGANLFAYLDFRNDSTTNYHSRISCVSSTPGVLNSGTLKFDAKHVHIASKLFFSANPDFVPNLLSKASITVSGSHGGGIVLSEASKKIGLYTGQTSDSKLKLTVGYQPAGDTTATVEFFRVEDSGIYHKGVKINNYTHPTGDGNLHVPVTGTTNNGKVLKAGATAGSISWQSLSTADISGIGVINTLTTSHKTSLVGAINEVKSLIPSSTSTGSFRELEIGRTNSVTFVDFHTSTTMIDYDARILCNIGNNQNGKAILDFVSGFNRFVGPINIEHNSAFNPNTFINPSFEISGAYGGGIVFGDLNKRIGLYSIGQPDNSVSFEVGYKLPTGNSVTLLTVRNDGVYHKSVKISNYVHPTGDGNLHVPATGTTNNRKFLKSGATAGSISWQSLVIADVATLQVALDAKAQKDVNYFKHNTPNVGFLLDSITPPLPATTKFYTYDGNHNSQADVVKKMWEVQTTGVISNFEKFAVRAIKYKHGDPTGWKNQAVQIGRVVDNSLFSAITFYDGWIDTNCPIYINKHSQFNKDNFANPSFEMKGNYGGGIVFGDHNKKVGIYTFTQPDGSLSFEVGYKLPTGNSVGLLSVSNSGIYHKGVKLATGGVNYTHPTGDGNLHVPATGTTNNGKFLKSGGTAGSISWQTLSTADISGIGAINTLTTSNKTNLVGAINEVRSLIQPSTGTGVFRELEIGRTNNVTFIDFHTSTTYIDYDARILCKIGNNLNGRATLEFHTGFNSFQGPLKVEHNGTFNPSTFIHPSLEVSGSYGGGIVFGDSNKKVGIYTTTPADGSLSLEVGYKLATGNSVNVMSVNNTGVYHKGGKLSKEDDSLYYSMVM